MKTIQLLDFDGDNSILPPIATLTFYDGNASLIETFLKQRVYDIVELNPWLLGSLRRDTHFNLFYSNDNIGDEFMRKRTIILTEDSQLNECADYNDIVIRIKSLNITLSSFTVNKQDEALFRVGLIRISLNKFAIFFSLNHALGDGNTFYQLYGMINEKSKPRALIVDRLHEFCNTMEELTCVRSTFSGTRLLTFNLKMILKALFCKPYIGTIHSVDLSAIEDLKLKYKKQSNDPDAFISTNDILTSYYFSNFGVDIGLMLVNGRSRFPQLSPDHAGNYLAKIHYQKGDFELPSKIRASLKTLRRVNSDIPLPSSLFGKKYSFLTSWASLYMDVQLSDCNQIFHLPLMLPQSSLRFGILFWAKKGELKLLTYTKDKTLSRKTMQNPHNDIILHASQDKMINIVKDKIYLPTYPMTSLLSAKTL